MSALRQKFACLAALLLVAGCAGAPAPRSAQRGLSEAPGGPVAEDDRPTADDIEPLALRILSEHLSRPTQEIELVSVEAIDWRDSSLGCPKAERDYRQVITPGHSALLRHDGRTWRVHMANGRGFVCEPAAGGGVAGKPVARLVLPVDRLQALARADLARRLGVPLEQVTLAGMRAVVWPDTSLGCAQGGRTYEPQATKGHIFSFSYRGRGYDYHTDLLRVFPCPPVERW